MHYRNGRDVKNGDKVVQLGSYDAKIVSVGILFYTTPYQATITAALSVVEPGNCGVCMCDCLHVDDVTEMLKEKGLDKRPAGK